jgi:glycosyltransferase involved in cell wall biosynthesis
VTRPRETRRRLDYICLQPTREGQASYAHVYEIVAGLRRRRWDVRVIQPPHPRAGALDGIRRAVAVTTTQIRYLASCRLRPARFVYLRAHFAALPTAIFARIAGSIVVQEVNGTLEDAFDAWPQLRRMQRLMAFSVRSQLRWADAVITVTPGLAEYVADFSGRQRIFHVVGNGANVDRFQPATAAISPGRPTYVVFVGALATWQGIDTVLSAVEAASWPAGVDLVIAGDGKERGRIEVAAKANPHIQWLGTIPYSECPPLVAGSLAALVPKADVASSSRGLSPLKLFEAMASGVPVVASDLPGLGDVVRTHDCGIIIQAGDPDALARSVAKLAADPAGAAEMGARGRDAAVALYSWDARAGQTEQVLLWAAGRRRAGSRSAGRGRASA